MKDPQQVWQTLKNFDNPLFYVFLWHYLGAYLAFDASNSAKMAYVIILSSANISLENKL